MPSVGLSTSLSCFCTPYQPCKSSLCLYLSVSLSLSTPPLPHLSACQEHPFYKRLKLWDFNELANKSMLRRRGWSLARCIPPAASVYPPFGSTPALLFLMDEPNAAQSHNILSCWTTFPHQAYSSRYWPFKTATGILHYRMSQQKGDQSLR